MEKEGKEQILIELKKDIEELEKQIKYSKFYDIKNTLAKNILINTCRVRFILPYILTFGVIAGGFKYTGLGYPFYRDDVEEYLYTKKTIDASGFIKTEEQYGEFSSTTNIIKYYTNWQEEVGVYTRRILSYSLGNLSLEKINEIINNGNINVDNILGFPIAGEIETRDSLTKEEINSNGYIELVIYNVDKNDYIIVKEEVIDNISISVLYGFVALISILFPEYYRNKISNFNYFEYTKEIEEKYEKIDIKKLNKKLKIKMDNYNRVK